MEKHYDVIIIGDRPTGASLAMRLNRQELMVLRIERATFPTLSQPRH